MTMTVENIDGCSRVVLSDELAEGPLCEEVTKTATGSESALQLGTIADGREVWAVLEVTAASGTSPTLDVTIESDTSDAMSSPTTRATFTQVTAAGAREYIKITGPVSDDYWRAKYTIGGTSPSFDFAIAIAVR